MNPSPVTFRFVWRGIEYSVEIERYSMKGIILPTREILLPGMWSGIYPSRPQELQSLGFIPGIITIEEFAQNTGAVIAI